MTWAPVWWLPRMSWTRWDPPWLSAQVSWRTTRSGHPMWCSRLMMSSALPWWLPPASWTRWDPPWSSAQVSWRTKRDPPVMSWAL
eukprot:2835974-Rhodomonas_salina.1